MVVYESVTVIGFDQVLGNSGRVRFSENCGANNLVMAVFKNFFLSVLPASDWIEPAICSGSLCSSSLAVPSSVIPLVMGVS